MQRRIYLSNVVTAGGKYGSPVNDIDALQNEANFFRDEEHIIFNGIKSTDEVALYKLNGSRIPVQLNYSEANKVTLSLSGIPSGIYILKVNGKTTKISKQ